MKEKKYYGKEKCRILKQIRAEIARQNDIAWVVEECSHKGNCRGTCPKCEAEVRQLEKALERRAALGKTVAVVGISAGLSLAVTGCDLPFGTLGGKPELDGALLPPEASDQTDNNQAEFDGVEIPDTDTVAVTEEVLMGDVVEMGEIIIPETDMEDETDTWFDEPPAGVPPLEDYMDSVLVITVAETLPSCVAIEENCFYGTDKDGKFWRILWDDTTEIVEGETYEVEIGEHTELTYPDGYPDGGWTPEYEATASDVKKS